MDWHWAVTVFGAVTAFAVYRLTGGTWPGNGDAVEVEVNVEDETAGWERDKHDHDEQLTYLVNEWGALGTVLKVLEPFSDVQTVEVLHAAERATKRSTDETSTDRSPEETYHT